MRAKIWKELNVLQNRGSFWNLKRKHNLGGKLGGRYQQRMKILKTIRDDVDRRGKKSVVTDYLTDYILLLTLSPHKNFEQLAYEPQGTTP